MKKTQTKKSQVHTVQTLQIIAKQLDKKVKLKDIESEFKSKFHASLDGSYYYSPKKHQYIFYYKFNTIVFLWFTQEEVEFRVNALSGKNPVLDSLSQEYSLEVDEKSELQFSITSDVVKLKNNSLNYLEVLCLNIAQSVILDYYETVVESFIPRSTSFYEEIKQTGRVSMRDKEILKIGASALSMKHEIVANLFLLDKPEVTWDDSTVEKFYDSLYVFFDLKDRFRALEYKINMINDDIVFLNEILNYRKGHLMEVIIILLIAFEIGFTLFEHFMK